MRRAGLLALAAGLLFVAAARLDGLLAWVVCAPLFLAARGPRKLSGSATVGALFGLTAAIGAHVVWVARVTRLYFGAPPLLADASALALAALCGASYGALLGVALHGTSRARGLTAAMLAAAVWTAWESITVGIFPHYPWVSLAATQAECPALLQLARVVGGYGSSFAIALVGALLGLALEARATRWRRFRYAVSAAGLLLVLGVVGRVEIDRAGLGSSTCSLAAIDASIEPKEASSAAVLQRYESSSERAVAAKPSAVVWPESALPGYPEVDRQLRGELQRLSQRWGRPLIAGGPRIGWASDWNPRLYNSAYRIDGNGALQVYDKRALVPFAEYWPLGVLPRPSWLGADSLVPGSQASIFDAGSCRLGMLICFEAERPELARELVRAGAQALLILSNDAQLPRQAVRMEVAQARLRALESGLPVVRAANRGVSILIDRRGVTVERGRAGLLLATFAPGQPAPASFLAPFFLAACRLVAVGVVLLALVPRRYFPAPTSPGGTLG